MAKSKTSKTVSKGLAALNDAAQRTEELQMNDITNGYVAPERPKNMKVVSSGAGYHDFTKQPVFQGHFASKFLASKDIPANKTKKGDCIGFNFIEEGTEKEVIISNSYAINKALEDDKFSTSTLWWLEFQGKTMVKGKPFNRFLIGKC